MDNKHLAKKLLDLCGGSDNFVEAENCMTRLRVSLKDEKKADIEAIKNSEDVMGFVGGGSEIQIVLGPGKVAKVADYFLAELNNNEWKNTKDEHKKKVNKGAFQGVLKKVSQIFVPLIPGIMAAGLLLGVAEIMHSLNGAGILPDQGIGATIYLILLLLGQACFSFLTVFVGINAAKVFKCTTILGAMVGAIVMMQGVSECSQAIDQLVTHLFNVNTNIYNEATPDASLLLQGKGGVIGVIAGVWILSKIEHALRKKIPDTLDLIVTPLVSFLCVGVLMLLVIMPFAGLLSDGIANGLHYLGTSDIVIVKALYGFLLGALYLPLVLFGLHQGLFPFYTIEIQTLGYTMMICPQLMAGCAQVGAAIAVYIKCKRIHHDSLRKTIAGALPAGILGIGEPLIYGMSLPLAFIFVPIGLAGGCAGIWIVLNGCQALSYGPSALLAIPTMAPASMIPFAIGEVIAVVLGFIFTWFMISKKRLLEHKENSTGASSDGAANFNELVRS
ncbi:MAG: PTS transporter subunit EIIC [Coriobacteriia bacterium]|nr:PTS transporter subunit EIIC [Coriobacteriia bacterium]